MIQKQFSTLFSICTIFRRYRTVVVYCEMFAFFKAIFCLFGVVLQMCLMDHASWGGGGGGGGGATDRLIFIRSL